MSATAHPDQGSHSSRLTAFLDRHTARVMSRRVPSRWVALLLLDQAPTFVIAAALAIVMTVLGMELPQGPDISADFRGWLAAAVIAPVLETLVVCGIALFFRRGEGSDIAGALWAAGLAAVFHLTNSVPNAVAVFPSFLVQMLAYTYLVSNGHGVWKSMRYPLLIHSAHNTTAVLMLL